MDYYLREKINRGDDVSWDEISTYDLPNDFYADYADKINWYIVCRDKNLSEDFMRKFQDWIKWDLVSKYQKLSEDFINRFSDRLYWVWIIEYQDLTENLLLNNLDKIDFGLAWDIICERMELSHRFIREYNHYKSQNL
jgi:hypothetical protein